jgi:hypothetical protein
VIWRPFASWWTVEKKPSFSYLRQNQKNDQQWLFCLFCAISQKFVLRLNTHFVVMGHIYSYLWVSASCSIAFSMSMFSCCNLPQSSAFMANSCFAFCSLKQRSRYTLIMGEKIQPSNHALILMNQTWMYMSSYYLTLCIRFHMPHISRNLSTSSTKPCPKFENLTLWTWF